MNAWRGAGITGRQIQIGVLLDLIVRACPTRFFPFVAGLCQALQIIIPVQGLLSSQIIKKAPVIEARVVAVIEEDLDRIGDLSFHLMTINYDIIFCVEKLKKYTPMRNWLRNVW